MNARLLPLAALAFLGCEPLSGDADAGAEPEDSGEVEVEDASPGEDDAGPTPGRDAMVEGEDVQLEADDFECILNWPMVRHFRITNVLGHLDEAMAVASSTEGGTYPVGTLIQLVPNEAMVKRGEGWSPETNDWEFFALNTSASGTTIRSRGAAETVNAFGGNCFDCHRKAEPQWDFVCEDTHGCDPLPIGLDTILNVQNGDPRCD